MQCSMVVAYSRSAREEGEYVEGRGWRGREGRGGGGWWWWRGVSDVAELRGIWGCVQSSQSELEPERVGAASATSTAAPALHACGTLGLCCAVSMDRRGSLCRKLAFSRAIIFQHSQCETDSFIQVAFCTFLARRHCKMMLLCFHQNSQVWVRQWRCARNARMLTTAALDPARNVLAAHRRCFQLLISTLDLMPPSSFSNVATRCRNP